MGMIPLQCIIPVKAYLTYYLLSFFLILSQIRDHFTALQ